VSPTSRSPFAKAIATLLFVDGGTSTQVFLFPVAVSEAADERGLTSEREHHACVIRNAHLSTPSCEVER